MIITGATPCFQDTTTTQGFHIYGGLVEDLLSLSSTQISISGAETNPKNTLLCNLSILKEKVQQVESMVSIVVSPTTPIQQDDAAAAAAITGAGSVIQEIVFTASSMMYAFQKIALNHHIKASNYEEGSSQVYREAMDPAIQNSEGINRWGSFSSGKAQEGYNSDLHCPTSSHVDVSNNNNNGSSNNNGDEKVELAHDMEINNGEFHDFSSSECDIIELDAADLLAKYTHYCQICGKGFKRDANLRMHMRAHGDEYKTNAALSNPLKKIISSTTMEYKECSLINMPRKYSCPYEGCRWNKKHTNFQPLKSMICVKNHYRRSHCPKTYVCNLCNRKQFSVLSDLRTHEKHCGDLKWQCSCGTTFSRKDKLMGHLSLFVGHTPAINGFAKLGNPNHHTTIYAKLG